MTMEIIPASPAGIEKIAADMKAEGRRLVVITCTAAAEEYDLTYSFARENDLRHYRMTVPEGTVIPSIGASYGGAFVYENEIHDLYGFTFTGMTIDFGGTFIRTSVPYPFKKKETPAPTVTKVPKEGAS
ncbi:NADH-quinone oxidoreductase subunit C [Methanocorpusculum vombati]|uniref:NADH-quinone oxidoreductase subunit C n=1 Tax=Methanocorpusculum vombati TaxID=3002864 RepID=A0ABT4IL81_9EURY|nr:NADH-quinone oxidoreductase subunit C [Methanocorpusculum vombati]MCZ9318729.1 NADH-quinone oxidoreductase subunit C [Methanocorpusculum sp.]MCZ0862099.1 NADH-quinone oxidoreductase subunit C [Methanocorpusculum vombati]MDE2520495.1 NADH-quinone oxidoreductase subunit C [Methanocorpusculum sp.]MDE2534401.1 NADH-quinone oxidoreductase subunit C [Methanocorpusculum sp.]MDE2546468.1 NADH-quinone oxidoreductase subunit C [Methanocorpusculum sp.]